MASIEELPQPEPGWPNVLPLYIATRVDPPPEHACLCLSNQTWVLHVVQELQPPEHGLRQ